MRRVALHSSETVALSCTAQNLTCSQEFRPHAPPSSDPLHVSRAVDVVVATMSVSLPALVRRLKYSWAGSTTTSSCYGAWWYASKASTSNVAKPIFNARKSIIRPAECVAPRENILCTFAHLYSRPTNLTFIFHSPFFIFHRLSHRVVRFDFRRVLTLHVFHNSMRQQAVQQFLSRLVLSLPVELAACP